MVRCSKRSTDCCRVLSSDSLAPPDLTNSLRCSAPAADVLTIENSRSGDEMIRALSKFGYSRDLGPGVYDVHRWVLTPHRCARQNITTCFQSQRFSAAQNV